MLKIGKAHGTIKGFTQNYLMSFKLTYDAIKDIALKYQEKNKITNCPLCRTIIYNKCLL